MSLESLLKGPNFKLVFGSMACLFFLVLYYTKPRQLNTTTFNPNSELENQIKTTKLLLLTFPRSGSTVLWNILSANDDTFALFEPFHPRVMKRFMNDTDSLNLDMHQENVDLIENYIKAMFNCEFPYEDPKLSPWVFKGAEIQKQYL